MTARSPLIASAIADIREYVALMEFLVKTGQLDAKSAIDGLMKISEAVDEIEQVAAPKPDLTLLDRLQVMTLADVARMGTAGRVVPALSLIEGGRS